MSFRQADATSLPAELVDLDAVLMANLLCRLPSPKSLLGRLGGPRGLVRVATQRELGQTGSAVPAWARHRVRIYAATMACLLGGLVWSLVDRPAIRVDVIRDRGVMARWADDGAVENVYRVQLMNQTDAPQRLQIGVSGLPGARVVAPEVLLGPVEDRLVQVSVRVPAEQAARWVGQTLALRVDVASRNSESSSLVSEGSTFIVPR